MVWGVVPAKGFGDFFPDGYFEYDTKTRDDGWFARLREHYAAQSAAEQKRLYDYKGDPDPANVALHYSSFPGHKLTKELGASDGWGIEPPVGAIEPHELPRSYDTVKKYASLGSFFKLAARIRAVDEALKAIIERLEPGVHDFHPIKVQTRNGDLHPTPIYILRIGQYFDAYSKEDTDEGVVRESTHAPGLLFVDASKKGISGLAMKRDAFGQAHLWRDRAIGESVDCFSDELIAEIKAAGLRIPKCYKMREV